MWIFLGLSAALSWSIWFLPNPSRVLYISVAGWRVTWPLSNLKLVVGNCLPGVLALIWASAEGQLNYLLSSLVAWRVERRWYVFAIVFPCGIFAIASVLVLTFYETKLTQPTALILVNSLVSLLFGPIWEEMAWRAFALRKFQVRHSQMTAALIIGVYWAVWHIPMWNMTLSYLTPTLLLVISVNLVCWSVIFAFLYDRSGQSLPVVILLHATILVVQNLVFAMLSSDAVHIIPIAAALSFCLAIIAANDWTRSSG